MTLLAVLMSVLLPWAAGTLLVLPLVRNLAARWLLAAGYGWFVGALVLTLVMRGFSALHVRFAVVPIAAVMLAVFVLALWRALRSGAWLRPAPVANDVRALPQYARIALVSLIALAAVRTSMLAYEALALPLVALDTWSQWASKSRVWFEFRELVPFVDPSGWLARAGNMNFTDSHPAYPATVPLLQVWTALCLGRWDESLVNAAWPVTYVALGLAFYGQLRRLAIAALPAMFATYALLSLPFLTIYVALAGLADLYVAAAYGLAAMSLWHWSMTRTRADLILAIVMAVVCASIKQEGLFWDLTLLAGAVAAWSRRAAVAELAVAAIGFVLYLIFGPPTLQVRDYVLVTEFRNVLPYVYDHLFVMDNWHLLWYAAVGVLAWNWRLLMRERLAPATTTMIAGVAFVFVVFSFTSASIGVIEESLTNRLPFQLVPALVFFLALVLRERQRVASHEREDQRLAGGLPEASRDSSQHQANASVL